MHVDHCVGWARAAAQALVRGERLIPVHQPISSSTVNVTSAAFLNAA
jgi:hypothetical protein